MMSKRPLMPAMALALILASAIASPSARAGDTQSLLNQQYKITAQPLVTETDYSIGTTPAQIAKLDASRIELVVVNLGSGACEVKNAPDVSATSGFVLAPNGGTVIEGFRDDLSLPTLQMWAVCAAASTPLHVIEVDLQ